MGKIFSDENIQEIITQPRSLWMLIFATQRTNAVASRLLAISLSMDAHLCYAKNQRCRFAAFGYLALYGCSSLLRKEPTLSLRGFWLSRSLWMLIFATQRTNAVASRLLAISLSMDAHLCYAK
ncbi:hypothetical protein QMM61_16765, partial [Leptospira santarosai]|nr:hypothetical protein [Leptospira santarosai]